jgi:hypothetical protein
VSPAAPPCGILESLSPCEAIPAIYVGYFDRAPDPGGFAYWEAQYNTSAAPLPLGQNLSTDQALTGIVELFAPQAESLALYSFLASGPLSPNSQTDITGVDGLISGLYHNLCSFTRI